MTGPAPPTDAEDLKILTLARSARARTGARQGGCLRDTDGRTYAATSIALPHLELSAIQLAVAMAVASGAGGVEAVALCADGGPAPADLDVLQDMPGSGVVVWVCDAQGAVTQAVEVDGAR